MKQPKSKSKKKFTGKPSKPLTAAQKKARYEAEAAKARKEAAKKHRESEKAHREALRANAAAVVDLARAQRARAEAGAAVAKEASDIARHNKAGAYLEALRATRDLAKAAHYQAEITRHEASAKRDEARSRRDAARSRKEEARERRDKTKARTVGLPGPARPGEWILGGNDRVPDCAAAAVANSLLAATGWRASDDDVIDLYCRAGGTTVQAALRAAERFGLGSMRPSGFGSLPGPDTPEDGFLVELELEEAQLDQGTWDWEPSPVLGEHAVYLDGGQVVSWGFATPVTCVFLTAQVTGAWWVRWK